MLSEYIEIGEVLRPQGIKGQVKVRPDSDEPEHFLTLKTVFVKGPDGWRPLSAEGAAVRDGYVYLWLDHAADREAAEAQRGLTLYVDRAHARKLGKDEWFICDLVGCRVETTSGEVLGTLSEVLSPGANHVFAVDTKKGRLLVAAVKKVLHRVDVSTGLVVLDADRLNEVSVYE